MLLQWTASANHDLVRLHDFLHPVNRRVAAQVVQRLVAAGGAAFRESLKIPSPSGLMYLRKYQPLGLCS